MRWYLLALLVSTTAHAVTLEVIGPCKEEPVFVERGEVDTVTQSIGQITKQFLDEDRIPYKADQYGVLSINNSPYGQNAIEQVSNTVSRYYGWCYTVDGRPGGLMDQTYLDPFDQDAIIRWTYAFAEKENGVWTKCCVPAYTTKPDFACGPKTALDWRNL